MSKGLRISLIMMGLFFILLGIFLNFQLYTSLTGGSPLHKYSYGAIGVGLDVSKVICLILGAFLIQQATGTFVVAGIVSLVFYLALSLISWAAGWGFTLVVTQHYENQAFQQSTQRQAVQADVDDAITEVKRFSPYADPTEAKEAQSKQAELQAQLDTLWASSALNSRGRRTGQSVRSQLGGFCPGTSWYHKRYCSQIQALESKIQENKTLMGNHAAYLAAVKHKNAMIKGLGEIESSGSVNHGSYMHPLFIGMGAIFETEPQSVKYRLLLLTSAMIELLGGLFFVMGILLKRKQKYSISEIVAMETQKHQMLTALGVNVIDLEKTEYTKLDVNDPKTSLHTQ
ncbi:MAG: hypothetical protein DRR08_17330 [Candidatus Parabeggiatoa sp. nov. 2]|nr:MAG: hypothetical protein B6247_28450 [Beggiatoa sp. 4572_84]RKZ58075.1 MAG: hypothetical protein DRR08_17330 [Gammaproteobacteria bacterium]HEC83632.1 hypothetical protein [Thioploca sp.]